MNSLSLTTDPVHLERKSNRRLMENTLEERIDRQETWTFRECLGLASELNLKVRVVVVTVLARGKNYVEREVQEDK